VKFCDKIHPTPFAATALSFDKGINVSPGAANPKTVSVRQKFLPWRALTHDKNTPGVILSGDNLSATRNEATRQSSRLETENRKRNHQEEEGKHEDKVEKVTIAAAVMRAALRAGGGGAGNGAGGN